MLNAMYVGIAEQDRDHGLAWPNPTTGMVRLTTDAPMTSVEVFDFTGRKVFSAVQVNDRTLEVDTRPFGRGVYYFKVVTRQGIMTEKVVVSD
jgi:hypothetical protein